MARVDLLAYAAAVLSLITAYANAAELLVPTQFPTIQGAIVAAQPGDTVLVTSGTYSESLNLGGKAITLRSTGGAANSFLIAPSANTAIISCISSETAATVIEGFTVLNSNGAPGLKIVGASPTIRNCIVQNCQLASGNGAGLQVSGTNPAPTFSNCYFISNKTLSGNGGAASLTAGVATFTNCYFQSNEANSDTDCRGGAVHAAGGRMIATGCSFTSNAARGVRGSVNGDVWSRGGAVCIDGVACSFTDCTFGSNLAWAQRGCCSSGTARAFGGAVAEYISQSSYLRVAFSANSADGTVSSGGLESFGGASYFGSSADPILDSCTYLNCRALPAGANTFGGGIVYEAGCGGTTSNCTFTNCTSTARGGALHMDPGAFPIVRDCTISNCSSAEGGGAYVRENATPFFLRTQFIACSAQRGGGIRVQDNSNILIDSCRFTGCTGSAEGGAIRSWYAAISVRSCIFQSNTSPSGSVIRADGDTNRWPTLSGNNGCGNSGAPTNWIVGTTFDAPPYNTNVFVAACGNDCNSNGISDSQEIAAGLALDCNSNSVPDSCDIAAGSAPDCNGNGRPDTCDIASGLALDCNINGIPDACDIAGGVVPDCDGNGRPDACDIASGVTDCNSDGILDACQPDCDMNGIADVCEITSVNDCNGNGVPDACDFAEGKLVDRNGDGVPDSCQQLDFTGLLTEIVPITDSVSGLPTTAVCWRVYATFSHPGASVLGVFGDSTDVLSITAIGGFYQSASGGDTADQILCTASDPSLRYDSFLTIGGECFAEVSLAQIGFDFTAFNAGGGITSDNAILYTFPGAANSVAGADGRVLLMQLTTNAGVKPSGIFNLLGDNAGAGKDNEWFAFGMTIPDPVLVDCNGNGTHDAIDIATGAARDCNLDGVPDACQFANPNADCDGDGQPDVCEIARGTEQDVNNNGVPDACECLGDVNGDGAVNVEDIVEIIVAWGDPNPGAADLDGDGQAGGSDLAIVLQGWGSCL
jgi:hypothetical protein